MVVRGIGNVDDGPELDCFALAPPGERPRRCFKPCGLERLRRPVGLAAAAPPESLCILGVRLILLHIIARGKIGRSPEGELVERYAKRLTWPVKLTEWPDTGAGKVAEPLTPCRTVLLDERGKAMSSEDFAALLGRWRDDGVRETRFMLGAADGHSDAERASADLLLAFGPATWPHMLARAMLMEQLYRATTILAGHPYHRAG